MKCTILFANVFTEHTVTANKWTDDLVRRMFAEMYLSHQKQKTKKQKNKYFNYRKT